MKKCSKIYVAGHRGLVGSAILRNLQKQGYTNLVYITDNMAQSTFVQCPQTYTVKMITSTYNLLTLIPALIHKFHVAHKNNVKYVEVWGTGIRKREFLYSDDLADACLFLMNNYESGNYWVDKLQPVRGKFLFEPHQTKRKEQDSDPALFTLLKIILKTSLTY